MMITMFYGKTFEYKKKFILFCFDCFLLLFVLFSPFLLSFSAHPPFFSLVFLPFQFFSNVLKSI